MTVCFIHPYIHTHIHPFIKIWIGGIHIPIASVYYLMNTFFLLAGERERERAVFSVYRPLVGFCTGLGLLPPSSIGSILARTNRQTGKQTNGRTDRRTTSQRASERATDSGRDDQSTYIVIYLSKFGGRERKGGNEGGIKKEDSKRRAGREKRENN